MQRNLSFYKKNLNKYFFLLFKKREKKIKNFPAFKTCVNIFNNLLKIN